MGEAASETAVKIWPVLVEVAHQRTTITYGDLQTRIGFGTSHLSAQLDVILDWCNERKFQPLTMLVVDAADNLPKCEPWVAEDFPAIKYTRAQKRVWDFQWAEHTGDFVRYALALTV